MHNKNKAFSLIEILISLVILSCVTAAFAPVISKRIASPDSMGEQNEAYQKIIMLEAMKN